MEGKRREEEEKWNDWAQRGEDVEKHRSGSCQPMQLKRQMYYWRADANAGVEGRWRRVYTPVCRTEIDSKLARPVVCNTSLRIRVSEKGIPLLYDVEMLLITIAQHTLTESESYAVNEA